MDSMHPVKKLLMLGQSGQKQYLPVASPELLDTPLIPTLGFRGLNWVLGYCGPPYQQELLGRLSHEV